MKAKSQKIGALEKVSFFLANVGNIPLMSLLSSFFTLFYTTIVGLDPAALGTLFLISKVADGISDPIMGYFLDKFPVTKMGKFRPMLILGTVICVINYIFLWFGAVWSPVGKYVIVYITYLLLGWTFDIMDISLNSLLPVMTAENKERNSLSLIKALGYGLGGAAISILAPIIVASGTLESYYKLTGQGGTHLPPGSCKQGTCRPGINTIAAGVSLSRSTVKRAQDDLMKAGLVEKSSRRRENGSLTSNL